MATRPRLNLTRDQLASFLQDHEQIKQFEKLFATVDSNTNDIIPGVEFAAGNSGQAANDALAEIAALAEALNKEPSPASASQLAVIESQLTALNVAPPASIATVTSVAASGGTTGLTFTGSPITTSGTFTLGGTLAVSNGGTGATTAATAITNLGATTLGGNMFTLTNPSAITFPRFNADNTVSALDAASFRTAIGAGTGGGSVTSVSGAGTVNGLTLTGTVTTSGSLTLGGTLSGIANSALTNSSITINGSAISLGGSVSVGTVTSASVVSANGFAGTVANATTTPAITLTTTITGLLKGNGTAISAATADVDYIAPSAPVTKTADFTVAVGETWLINNKSGSTCTVTLPSAATYPGRYLTFQNYQDQTLVSASSNVIPQGGGSAGTAILTNVSGNWATLVSNGTNWVIMQAASFNNLLY